MVDLHTLVIHHSADLGTFASIKVAHLKRGYTDIGYNGVIERDGTFVPGRPFPEKPAANSKRNTGTLAICAVGDNSGTMGLPNAQWNREQWRTIIKYTKALMTVWPDLYVCGHCDLPWASTLCPGLDIRRELEVRGVYLPISKPPLWTPETVQA